jgi:hypothetical protein
MKHTTGGSSVVITQMLSVQNFWHVKCKVGSEMME